MSSIYKKKTAQGVRISVASSQRLMEIMEVPSNEIQGNLIHCKLGPLAALEELKRLTKNKEVQDARLQGLLRDPIAPLKKLTQEDEELLIQKWFKSKKPYYWIQLHDSQHLQENHLDDQKFQNMSHYLTSLDLRGAKNLGEMAFISLHTNCPNLKYLNISGWPLVRLSHLKKAPGLLWNSLEFSKGPIFPSLQRLIVQGCNPLREINVHLPALESLEAGGNTKLVSFSLIAPVLKYLDMTGHQVKEEALNLQISSAANINLKGVNIGRVDEETRLKSHMIQAEKVHKINVTTYEETNKTSKDTSGLEKEIKESMGIIGTLTEEIEKLKTARGKLGRIRKELVDLNETRSEALCLDLVDKDPYKWRVAIKGPENSYYSGGIFFLDISLPDDYPFKQPTIRFSTKIFHPNISETTGFVCSGHLLNETPSVNISYLNSYPGWSPAFTVRRLLEVIRDMLEHPSENCEQSKEAQFLLKTNREAFGKKAREWTKDYARQAQNKEKSKSEGI